MIRSALLVLELLLGAAAGPRDGGTDLRASLAQYIPAGWESGGCPASYGPDSVLCAGTDRGPFKVDHHVPTVWIRTPPGSCAEVRETGRKDAGRKHFKLTHETPGQCGAPGAPCVERAYRGSSADGPLLLEYVRCPPGGRPLVVAYVVSSRVPPEFPAFARRQVGWSEAQTPALHPGSIQIGPEPSLEPASGDPTFTLIRSHHPEIERCRADSIAAGRTPVGRLVARWRIGPEGHVLSAETVSDDTRDPTLAGCVLARIRTWDFPRPKGGGEVFITCPFVFRAGD
jgi:hypothetical protein